MGRGFPDTARPTRRRQARAAPPLPGRIWQPRGMPHTVRTARPDEVGTVLRAYDWLFAPPGSIPELWDPKRAAETLEWILAAEDATVLVVEDGGAPAGGCTRARARPPTSGMRPAAG